MEHRVDIVDGIATLTFCSPEKLNALTLDGMRRFGEAVSEVSADDDVRAIIVTGEGRAFCVGVDLGGLLGSVRDPETDAFSRAAMEAVFDDAATPMAAAVRACAKPMVAAVNGIAAGGGVGIALGCDVVVAAESASFNLPFVPNLSILPDCGTSWLLSRAIGSGRARAAMLLGEPIPADKAEAWGMVWEVVPSDALADRAKAIAGRLAAGPLPTYPAVREAVDRATNSSLSEQLAFEKDRNVALSLEPNFREGVEAFVQKRRPAFAAVRG